MMMAKIFENGRSQAVRLPKECRFDSDHVYVNRIGDMVILVPDTDSWGTFIRALDMFSEDFMQDGRAETGRLDSLKDYADRICSDYAGQKFFCEKYVKYLTNSLPCYIICP